MNALAKEVLQLSLMASWVVLAVLLIRFCFRRLPKKYSYLLWGIVLVRFACPFYIKSPVGLITTLEVTQPSMRFINPETIELFDRADQFFSVWSTIWLLGMLILLGIHLHSYIKLKKRVSTAVRMDDGVYETDQITGAFVMGIWKPRIYIETGIGVAEQTIILCHERTHLKRYDHIIKLLAYVILIIHWFNPLTWLSVWLMCKDMEMSCDETVAEQTERAAYSEALLAMAVKNSGLRLPLAFGESHTKSRIKNILNYRKPGKWVAPGAIIITGISATLLLTNASAAQKSISIIGGADGPTSIFLAGKTEDGNNAILEDIIIKTVRKHYESPESVPKTLYYEEYIDGTWWSGELTCTNTPNTPTSTGQYEAEYTGFLQKAE